MVETNHNGTETVPAYGRAKSVRGKVATVTLGTAKILGSITAVHTVGREYTNAEQERTLIVLSALQKRTTILSQHLVKQIYFPAPERTDSVYYGYSSLRGPAPSVCFPDRPLNQSQSQAVRRILSLYETDRICLVQGPPGTGKTTVIAAAVKSLIVNPSYTEKRHIWLLAQSNVAVKNIAEKLAEVDFWDFKLIVSNEYHFEWCVIVFDVRTPFDLVDTGTNIYTSSWTTTS